MKIKSKYKIAKRLGNQVFEKTQGVKYATRAEKKNIHLLGARSKTNYGTQLLEKQKVRFTYLITSKKLASYAKKVIESKTQNQEEGLYILLEKRLDNVVLKAGFGSTRGQAKQIVSHGIVTINGRKITIPSYEVKQGDVIEVKESRKNSPLFADFEEKSKDTIVPAWLKVEPKILRITIQGLPEYKRTETHFDLGEVLQFYKR